MEQGNSDKANRVISYLGDHRTHLELRNVPHPSAGELLLSMRVSGLCGTDLFKLENDSAIPGSVLGHEIVGEIIAVGEGENRFKTGDRVVVPHHVPCGSCLYCKRGNETMCRQFRDNLLEPGGFAEKILVRSRAASVAVHRLPESVSDEAAVFMEPAGCVLRGIQRSGIGQEGLAVIQGAGSMGLLHLLVLRVFYPDLQVLVVDPLKDRQELAIQLGAHGATDPGSGALDVTSEYSEGTGADVIFDTVGGSDLLNAGLHLCREGGTVVLFAHAAHEAQASFDLNEVFKFEKRILGTYSGTLKEQAEIFKAITSGSLDPTPLVSHRFSLDRFDEAVDLARNRNALKILLCP